MVAISVFVILFLSLAIALIFGEFGAKPSETPNEKNNTSGYTIQTSKNSRFLNRFIPNGGVTSIYSHEMILMLEITDELAYGFLGDRLLTERILRRWLDGWEEISGYESGRITVKLDGIDLITVKHAFFSRDKVVEFHR